MAPFRALAAVLPATLVFLACSSGAGGGGGGGGMGPDGGGGFGNFGAFGGSSAAGGGAATGGAAGGSACGAGLLQCGAECVDVAIDAAHCGGCSQACAPSQVCVGGGCTAPPDVCPPGGCPAGSYCDLAQNKCLAGCLNDEGCKESQRCESNSCVGCPTGLGNCDRIAADGCETPIATDTQNCGACGKVCPSGRSCSGGACVCAGNTLDCGGSCVDTQSNDAHCGSCNNKCTPPANATASCAGGKCQTNCNTGYHLCGTSCASNTDVATCGTSCTPCTPPANATATCDGTSCDFTCNTGYVRDGAICVENCAAAGCSGFNWCDTSTGLCKAGCTKHTQCKNHEFCAIATHECLVTADSSCPAGYKYHGQCSNGKSHCSHGKLPSGTKYVFVSPCPAGTVQRGSFYCSDVTRICVPDL